MERKSLNMDLPVVKKGLVDYTPLPQETLSQRWLTTKTQFDLKDNAAVYTLATGSSTQTFNVDYSYINFENVTTLSERNLWLRNVGLAWIMLGAMFYLLHMGSPYLWLGLGIACIALHFLGVINYSVIPAKECNILVIRNKKHDQVMEALRNRKRNYYRQFVVLRPQLTPAENLENMTWMHENGVITAEEFEKIKKAIEVSAADVPHPDFDKIEHENGLN